MSEVIEEIVEDIATGKTEDERTYGRDMTESEQAQAAEEVMHVAPPEPSNNEIEVDELQQVVVENLTPAGEQDAILNFEPASYLEILSNFQNIVKELDARFTALEVKYNEIVPIFENLNREISANRNAETIQVVHSDRLLSNDEILRDAFAKITS